MIKLKDLLFEFKNQLFTPKGGQIDLTKIPKINEDINLK